MIISFNTFFETVKGKTLCFFLASLIFLLQSCQLYKATEIAPDKLVKQEQVLENVDAYKFYLHTTNNSYVLTNPILNKDGSVTGIPKITSYELPDSTWGLRERKTYWENHKYDINFYCSQLDEESNLRADIENQVNFEENERITINPAEMEKVTITSMDREHQIAGAALVVLIVVAVVVGTFLIVLLTTVLAKASSDEANASSDESSGNSGSNSGGSGSGSSGG